MLEKHSKKSYVDASGGACIAWIGKYAFPRARPAELIKSRILSICLGRPMAIEDADCDCEIPLDMDDSELEIFCRSDNTRNASLRRSVSGTPSSSGLGGFLSLLRLCQLSGKITRSVNYVHLKQNRKGYKKAAEPMRLARELDLELESWLKNVPDPIAYLASSASSDSSGDVHLTMYIISYIVHAGCVINLHWYVFPVGSRSIRA